LSADDVHSDVNTLTAALNRRRAERRAYGILIHPEVRRMLDELLASGRFKDEEQAIEIALRSLVTARTP
jgi:hypothetical protein